MKQLTYLILLLSNISWACDPVTLMHAGDKANCDGYLFSKDKEAEVRQHLLDLDTYKQLDASNQRIIQYHMQEEDLLKQQTDLWHNQAQDLSKQLISAEDSSFWKKTLFFGLGVLASMTTIYGIKKAAR